MRKIIFLVIASSALFLSSCNNSEVTNENYIVKVMDLYSYESKNPTQFLNAEGKYREGFWGDTFVVNCTIKNSAKVSLFKDVILRVTYYSATNSAIGSEDYTIYKNFLPNSEKTVELEIKNYKDVESIGWEVIGAVGSFEY